jgi:hypothetical protein
MAYQKLQVSSALAVIPSDFINIPNPSDSSISGTTDGTTGLTDTSATFTDGSVKIGDIVYDTSNSVVGRVTAIAATVLTLDNGNGVAVNLATGASYVVYKDTNNAAVLYVGVAGDLVVEMANSGLQPTQATFTAAANGYHPIQVKKVLATGTAATNIVALW